MDARFNAAEFHGDEVLSHRNLAKSYGDKHLFDGISLKVEGASALPSSATTAPANHPHQNDRGGSCTRTTAASALGPQVRMAYLPQIIHFDHRTGTWWRT